MTARNTLAAEALPPSTETFGQPATNTHLIVKLRAMDPALLASITAKETK